MSLDSAILVNENQGMGGPKVHLWKVCVCCLKEHVLSWMTARLQVGMDGEPLSYFDECACGTTHYWPVDEVLAAQRGPDPVPEAP